MKKLKELWDEMPNKTDKFSVHSYDEVYEELLAPYRHKAKMVLEIGIFRGDSLLLWEKYFTNAEVHGIDCSETPHDGMADLRGMIAEGTHHIHIGNATDADWIEREFGDTKWDLVLEDSSHDLQAQLKSIEIFSHKMAPGSLLVIEDIQNPDRDRHLFENLDSGKKVELIDLRAEKNRYDDFLVLVYF